jgi:hypothetical protein
MKVNIFLERSYFSPLNSGDVILLKCFLFTMNRDHDRHEPMTTTLRPDGEDAFMPAWFFRAVPKRKAPGGRQGDLGGGIPTMLYLKTVCEACDSRDRIVTRVPEREHKALTQTRAKQLLRSALNKSPGCPTCSTQDKECAGRGETSLEGSGEDPHPEHVSPPLFPPILAP